MRCETPWLASCGATSSARTMARPISAAAPPASRVVLFRDDIFECGPRKYREDHVVEAEKRQEGGAVRRDAGPDAADDERDRERQEEQREDHLAAAARRRHRRE